MPIAKINDLRIHYDLVGDAGDPIVFIHGYGGDVSDWRHQIDELCIEHRVLVLDNRGHGESEAPAHRSAYSVDAMAEDTRCLIGMVGIERYHLVGHSIGGAIAQEIALGEPERLLSLTLVDTSDWFGDHDEPGGTPPYIPPADKRVAMGRLARMARDAVEGGWSGLLGWRGSASRAHEIRVPTLIVFGSRDASRIIEGSWRLEDLIPDAEVVVIDGAGHSPHRERPGEFNASLRRFWTKVGG